MLSFLVVRVGKFNEYVVILDDGSILQYADRGNVANAVGNPNETIVFCYHIYSPRILINWSFWEDCIEYESFQCYFLSIGLTSPDAINAAQ